MSEILLGTGLLLLVLCCFTIFSYKAPYGMKAMGALANAACATFLVEAFNLSLLGDVLGMEFFRSVGAANGSLGGVAAAILVPLALGVSPVYAVLIGLSCLDFSILSGFVAGYFVSFLIKFIEKKVPPGVDLVVVILLCAPLSRLIASNVDPLVNSTLLQIGQVLIEATHISPIIMGMILGGLITVFGTSPLSSMALTSIIGLTGLPMAIGALGAFGSAFMNSTLFAKLKLGSKKDIISVAIEPLTQSDIISANPIPIYSTNFFGGAFSGIIVALMGLVNMTPGTATPVAGFAIMFAYNPVQQVLITAGLCALFNVIAGFLGSKIFSTFKVLTAGEIRGTDVEEEIA